MRAHQVLLIVGGILLFLGLNLVVFAFLPGAGAVQGEETAHIPAGAEWYYVFEFDMEAGATLLVEFEELSGWSLVVHILDEENYALYQETGSQNGTLLTTFGNRDSFVFEAPIEGKYYLIFEHGYNPFSGPKDVLVKYDVTGLRPTGPDVHVIWAGVGILAYGVTFLALGVLTKRRERRETPEVSDVILFEGAGPPRR